MEPVKVLDKIYWVGAVDFGIRDFHGYRTSSGSTYNAYLIIDEKITLVDTVKKEFLPELLSRISKIVAPEKIDQVVVNHAEMDHSSALPGLMEVIGRDKPIYISKLGEKIMKAQFPSVEINYKTVGTGDSLSLGKLSLDFLETRMVHWPDSMFSFCPQLGVLFSQDGFGMHLATTRRFNDEVSRSVWGYEALKYFANILTPYTITIAKTLQAMTESGLLAKIKVILPDHGLIWRSNLGEIVGLYAKWVKQEPSRKAVIVYDSMWKSTEKMARELADVLSAQDVLVKLMSLKSNHRSDVITELYNAGAVLVGSPTLNNDIYPTIAEILCYIRGLKFRNKVGGAFGSYGWSGEAPKLIQAALADLKYELPASEVRFQWVPTEAGLVPIKVLAESVVKVLPKEPVPPDFNF
ncbi:MAG: MBL fold metallo-hydrolase [Candidatus Adiutrix intracellularis]|jgi:flavorubredoxin|nr:MAG: MBL fold metallo-hydrolase [Candidatus Adiutrix intracellularis]MDR2826552.1 flavodoxin domain-containing protein [Candidatus Adiutrix intracellularis]